MSTKKLIHKQRIPYGGGFNLNLPERGMVGYGTNYEMLESRILAYRKANSIPIGLGFPDELEAAVCEHYPDDCKEVDPNVPQPPVRLRLNDVINGTAVMGSIIASRMAQKEVIVSEAEAERRAEICATCRYNVEFSRPCGGWCGALKRLVESITGSRKTSKDELLRSCHVCKCFLGSSVWVDLEAQLEPLPENIKTQFNSIPWCWKKTI